MGEHLSIQSMGADTPLVLQPSTTTPHTVLLSSRQARCLPVLTQPAIPEGLPGLAQLHARERSAKHRDSTTSGKHNRMRVTRQQQRLGRWRCPSSAPSQQHDHTEEIQAVKCLLDAACTAEAPGAEQEQSAIQQFALPRVQL